MPPDHVAIGSGRGGQIRPRRFDVGLRTGEALAVRAHALGMRDLPWSAEDVAAAIKQTIAANEFSECYIRPVIWLGDGGWNINVDGAKPHLGIATWAWGAYLGEAAIEAGIRANISSYTRHHVNVMTIGVVQEL